MLHLVLPNWAAWTLALGLAIRPTTILRADTLRVPQDFSTIQAAIVAAADDDTILVSPGTYAEQIHLLEKTVLVISSHGPEVTVIDGQGQTGYVVRITHGDPLNTVFSGFTIRNGRGGMIVQGASPTVDNCVFESNSISNNYGGGMAIFNGSPHVNNCSFFGNSAIIGGGMYTEFGAAKITQCRFIENSAGYGGGAAFVAGQVDLAGATFERNSSTSFGGGAYFNYGSPKVSRCFFTANNSLGGGAVYSTNAGLKLQDSRLAANTAFAGGGIYIAGGNTAYVVNSIVDNNDAASGAGVYLNSSSPKLINSTIAANRFGGIFTTYNSFPEVSNSILASNGNDDIWIGVEVYGNGRTHLNYSLVSGPLLAGFEIGSAVQTGVSPGFSDGDFRLASDSSAIDAGDNSAVPPWAITDFAGNPRFVDDPNTPDTGVGDPPIVDLGAYEFLPDALYQGVTTSKLKINGSRRRAP